MWRAAIELNQLFRSVCVLFAWTSSIMWLLPTTRALFLMLSRRLCSLMDTWSQSHGSSPGVLSELKEPYSFILCAVPWIIRSDLSLIVKLSIKLLGLFCPKTLDKISSLAREQKRDCEINSLTQFKVFSVRLRSDVCFPLCRERLQT